MKIRKGFVSNSSSSSFIIGNLENETLNNPYDIARYMIGCREWDKEDGKLIKKLEKALKDNLITKDTNLMFHSCNFDTYIVKDFNYNKIYISTCNNHEFDELNKFDGEDYELMVDAKKDKERFFYIEGGFYLTHIPYNETYDNKRCKKEKGKKEVGMDECFGELYKGDDEVVHCLECGFDKFPRPNKTKERVLTPEEQKQIDILRLKMELLAKEYDMTFEEVINEIKRRIKYKEKKKWIKEKG